MTTRREIVTKCGAGLAAIIAAGRAPAAFIRSMLAARNGLMASGGLSAKSYVQDGLVAMWDGIENAGWGVHEATASTWTDLTGHYNLIRKGSGGSWGDSYFQFNGTYPFYNTSFPSTLGKGPWTVECVYYLSQSMQNYTGLFGTRVGGQAGIYGLNYWSDVGGYNCGTGGPSADDAFTYNNSRAVLSPLTTTLSWHQMAMSFRNGDNAALAIAGSVVKNTVWSPFPDSHHYWALSNGIIVGAGYCVPASTIGNSDSSRTFKGRLGHLRIYNRILEEDILASNYAVDKARFNLPD